MHYAIMMVVVAVIALFWGDGDAFDKGWAALKRGDADRAIALFDEASRDKDLSTANKGRAYNNLGVAWAAKGDIDRAASQFELAARFLPDEPTAQRNRAIVVSTRARPGQPPVPVQAVALERASFLGLPTAGAVRGWVADVVS